MEEWKNRNIKKVKRLKNKHKGERCFILGNSPSLNKVDFSLIQDEILFGTNALFRGTERFGITPKYWAITNQTNWKAWSSTLQKLDTKLFIGGLAMKEGLEISPKFTSQENIYLIPQLGFMWKNPSNFSTDLSKGAYNGDTIIIDICLQACYDDQTEVLTKNGFKLFKDVTLLDKIATLNSYTDELEYHNPIAKQEYFYDGMLLSYEGRRFSLLVTPDHNIYIKDGRISSKHNFKLMKESERENDELTFKHDCNWKGIDKKYFLLPQLSTTTKKYSEKKIDILDYVHFMAWYLSEGCVYFIKNKQGYRVSIGQSDVHKKWKEEIFSLTKKVSESKSSWHEHDIVFEDKQWCIYLKQFGYAKDKFIPESIKELPPYLLQEFIRIYINGDGSDRGVFGRIIYTSSKKMSDDLQEIILKAGYSSSCSQRDNGSYCIYVHTKKNNLSTFKGKAEQRNYQGLVYDLTVPNHVMLIRRNGKITWSGNCYYMGFSEVYLLGIDLDYSKGYYFYEKDNKKLDIPLVKENLVHVLPSYEVCKKFYEIDNRKIFNATIGGKLKVFPRKKLKDIIKIKKRKIKRKENNSKYESIFSL